MAFKSFLEFYKTQKYKFFLDIVSTLLGVLIALSVNSVVDLRKDIVTYRAMLKAINVEARSNKEVFVNSFLYNYRARIVHREFSTRLSDDFLGNEIFLNHASDSLIDHLAKYVLDLRV